MPNLKIFAAIVVCVFVLVIGLEWLPKQYAPQTNTVTMEQTLTTPTNEEKAIYEKEMSRRDEMGYSIVGYFLLLSALLYLKILLQRSNPSE
jgi:preprotein translocase subunit SecG